MNINRHIECNYYTTEIDDFDGCPALDAGGYDEECDGCPYRLENIIIALKQQKKLLEQEYLEH